jgi:hypothetical protein
MVVDYFLEIDPLFVDAFLGQASLDIFKESAEIHIRAEVRGHQAEEVVLVVIASDGLDDIAQQGNFFEG